MKPSRARVDAWRPSELLIRAHNCLEWARRGCTAHGIWEYYDDQGIVSVRGAQRGQTDAICTDAEGNGLWIALMAPPLGNALGYALLEWSNKLDHYATWEEAGDGFAPTRMLAWQIVDRYYDLMGADREPESR